MTPARAMSVACAGAFVAALSTSLVAIAAPVIARDFDASKSDVSWVLTAYLLAVSCNLALMGRLADLFGKRRVIVIGFVSFAAASAACGLAPSLGVLVTARVVQGVAASALMATGPALITSAVEPSRRGRALGVQLAVTYVGLTIGPTLGGVLTQALGWHAIFFCVAGFATAALLLAVLVLPADAAPVASERRIDWAGAATFAAALGALLLALREGPPVLRASLGAIAIAAFAGFAVLEARHAAPLLPLALLRAGPFALGIAGAVLLYVVTFVLAWLLPFHLQHARGFDAAHAGALMTAQPATMSLCAPISGWLADRFGPRLPTTLGMVTIAVGLLLVGRCGGAGDAAIAGSLAVVGAGAGLYVAPNSALIMASAPRERQGTAAALAATARNVGMASGVALAVVLGGSFSFVGALACAAALAVLGALLGALRPVLRA